MAIRASQAGEGDSALQVARLVSSSVGRFLWLVARWRLHLRRERIGQSFAAADKQSYTVFRETVASRAIQQPTVLEVGFRLKVIRSSRVFHWLFQRLCILTTPFWSGFKGFGTKLWMANRDNKNYLGAYQWDGQAAARIYAEALVTILRPLSVRDSVWYRLYPETDLRQFFAGRQSHGVGSS